MPTDGSNIFFQVLKDYMVQTSLHGYQYLAEPGRHWFERFMWIIVHIGSTSCLLFIVYGMYVDYYHQLPVTTIKTIHYPIREVDFPGIAFCDINKLRKSKTLEFASSLYNEYKISVSEKRLGELLRNLGLLYDQSEQTNSATAVKELDEVLTAANITLNITAVMKEVAYKKKFHNDSVRTVDVTKTYVWQLSTPCEELLVKCHWESQSQPCEKIFTTRKTMEGFCCTFNYVRPTDNFNPSMLKTDKAEPPKTTSTAGPHMGLTVLVSSNLSDYYYPTIPVVGLKVLIFNPLDYPDTGSGGLTELLVNMSEELFFSMSAVTTQATKLVHDLDLDRRSCFFNSDIEEKFGELYSYSDCMMDCRIADIRQKCGCLPFYSPSRVETPVCSVQNIQCLLSNRDIWQTMQPHSLSGETTVIGGNFCPSPCYPTCSSTLYTVQFSSMPLSQELIYDSTVYPTVDIENHSLVHIYFGSPSTPLMLTDVLTTWFELLSNVGGVCGVFVGFSLMSIIEFIYFFTVRLAFEAFDRSRQQRTLLITEGPRKESPALEISTKAAVSRAPYIWGDIYPTRKEQPVPENIGKGSQRRTLGRSSTVQIFWNEISLPNNSKRSVHDVLF